MKKLFAQVSYSYDNFYNNLNTQGQMVFSIIMILLLVLCLLLLITYIVQGIQDKIRKNSYKKTYLKNVDNDDVIKEDETTNKSEIERIKTAISDALNDDTKPITLTNYEEDQEKTAIISIDELMQKAKELDLIDDESSNVNYLEKYNIDPKDVEEASNNEIKVEEKKEVKAFKVSQVISPIYGVKKEAINNK